MPKSSPIHHIDCAPLDAGAVLAWYDRHARDLPWRVSPQARARGVRPDPYRVWLSEVMLQQTTVAAVRDYFAKFLFAWPDVRALAAAPLDAVLSAWAGLGYYARARNLHACARAVVDLHDGEFPRSAEALRSLPGIGAYTSASIAAICFDEPVAVVDGNVERVVARLAALPVPVRDAKRAIVAFVQQAVPARAGDFAQAMMDLGATICAPRRANCLLCPLTTACAGQATGAPEAFPVPAEKKARPERYGHAYVLRRADGAVYLRQRAEKGLLAQMTEVPGSAWEEVRAEPVFPVAGDWHERGEVVHVFTHFRLTLSVWELRDATETGGGWWSEPHALDEEALPSLFRKVLARIGL